MSHIISCVMYMYILTYKTYLLYIKTPYVKKHMKYMCVRLLCLTRISNTRMFHLYGEIGCVENQYTCL